MTINAKKKNLLLKLAAFLTAAFLLPCFFVLFGDSGKKIVRADDPIQTYDIRSAEEFISYSRAYAAGGKNPKDVLNISINSGSEISGDGFVSLGTLSRPFAGTINVPSVGINKFRLYNCPLFNYVSTDAKITGLGTVQIIRHKPNETPAEGVLTSGALFANHVVPGTNDANWSVSLLTFEGEGDPATEYAGVIGEIADGATVTVSFTNATNLAVVGTGDTGLICGKLGAGATLDVTTAGSGGNLTVTASSGNAGSLVGKMESGSTLKFSSANNTRVNSVNSSAGYAGGVVGYADNVTIGYKAGVTDYTVSGTITGSTGAGGLFGYYKNTGASVTFDMEDTFAITDGTTVTSSGVTGGVFGRLENTGASFTFDGNSSSEDITVSLTGGSFRGGVCGEYIASALTNAFEITDTETALTVSGSGTFGGLIGKITDSPAYVKIHDVSCTAASGSLNGGLIGTIGSGGSFIDATGNITVSGTMDAGLIANMPQGVLRLSGVFDLSGFVKADADSGELVKSRNRALIYATGDGKGTNGNWTYKRGENQNVDDISGWGQVIRCDGTTLKESDLFTVDMTAHTVTVAAAVTSMATVTDFAKTALNIKLNTGAGVGALKFTSGSANLSSTLLAGTLSVSADISLAGTGLTGLTRDDGANAAFSGTFNGNNKTITFATGESYGLKGNGSALDANTNQGRIFQHLYNGLFAKTSNATVSGLTVSGTFKVCQTKTDMRIGGVAAFAQNGLTLTNVNSSINIAAKHGGDLAAHIGGVVGSAASDGLNISVTGGNIHPVYTDQSAANGSSYVGGAIGTVFGNEESSITQAISFTSCDLGLDYTGSASRLSCFGGAIARVSNGLYAKGSRTINVSDVDLDITVNSGHTSSSNFGAILGYAWYAADVTIDDLRIDADITASGGTANYGGLFQTATGYINIADITLNTADFSVTGGTFGFVANKTYVDGTDSADGALYLEVAEDDYDIAALTFTNSPNFSAFDEIVLDSRYNYTSGNIENNGNSIISITTASGTLTSDNGYYNQTTYGKTASYKVNSRTRYYYNIADAITNVSTAKYNFLIWSVKTYAHSSLSEWFEDATATFTGTLDMTGLSYYPVNLTSNVTFNNATLTLDNVVTEGYVKAAYSGEAGARTTRATASQHYLMHTSAFLNATGNITVSGASGLTLIGNVPNLDADHCGFIVAGTLGGSNSKNVNFNAAKIVLDGVHIVTDAGADLTTNALAPLLINKIGKSITLNISAAEQSASAYSSYAGSGKYAASSLIGDVGDASARAIYLTFTGLKFDSRSAASGLGNLDTTYGTTKSIFSRATILNSFLYAGESSGSYNFEISDDWSDGSTAVHNVTYGEEITSSAEYLSQQEKYFNSSYYVHPTVYESGSAYDFSTGFLPYVYTAYNLGQYKHELKINVFVSAEIGGCGKYDDPFVIDDDGELEIISRIINGQNVGTLVTIKIPSDYTSFNYTATGYTKNAYAYDTSNGGDNTYNINARKYFAGAYYVIAKDIELASNYVSLGTASAAEYAFRGVIIGRNVTITNTSPNPLILTSLGSVIKDVTVDVNVDYDSSDTITLTAPGSSYAYNYSDSAATYGAVIGQILGGDTIIDNVEVTFSGVTFSITANESSTFSRLVPIGGYVGTLLSGGLIFRNMTSYEGLTSSVESKVADEGYLYVNPIIGRVIAGYAFNENSGEYDAATTTVTIDNGDKNYTISDLYPSAPKLTVAYNNVNKYTITVPNGQALFVLGAIVNSGAGSASYNASTEQAYDGLSSSFWQAYRAHTTVRGGSGYSTVGTSAGDDYTAAQDDSYTANLVKVPYIIRAYTNKTGNVYLARCIANATAFNNVVNVTGNCVVPEGFRGIGNIYFNSANVRLGIQKMSGKIGATTNAYTITLSMRYLEYNHKYVSSYIAVASNSNNDNTTGFGLFTRLDMNGASDSNSVQYLVLKGSVFYDVYKVANGSKANYNFAPFNSNDRSEKQNIKSNDTEDATMRRTILSVGGLAGFVNNKFYAKNVTFNELYVEGAKYAGGLIGFFYASATTSNNKPCTIAYDTGVTNAGFVNVVGGQCAGGLIGKIYMGAVFINGASGGTDIIIRNVEVKDTNPNESPLIYFANMNTGVGGLIGNCWGSDKSGYTHPEYVDSLNIENKNQNALFIDNINLVKGSEDANVRVLYDRNGGGNARYNYAGGFVGSAHYVYLKITNSNLKCVNVSANIAGGFIGRFTQHFYLEIFNSSANGCETENGTDRDAAITGTRYAGGVVGWGTGRDKVYFQLRDFTVKNYNVESYTRNSNIWAGAGGIMGYAEGNNVPANDDRNVISQFNNLTVLNCCITTNYTNPTTDKIKYKVGTGGIIGVIDTIISGDGKGANPEAFNRDSGTVNKYKFSGYNILVKDCTLSHMAGGSSADNTSATNDRIGDLVGNNGVSTTLKFVGVSVQNSGYYYNVVDGKTVNKFCGKHVGLYNSDANNYGSDGTFGTGYVVFANYNAASGNESFGAAGTLVNDTTTPDDDFTNVAAEYPFVNVNPIITLGGKTLVGDGVADTKDNLPIYDIIADNGGFYENSSAKYVDSTENTNIETLNLFSSNYTGKLAMFSSEVAGLEYLGTDFPILILDDTNRINSHKMINSYLRLLTNTTHDFGEDKSGEYTVQIYKMTYDNGVFVPSVTGASVKRDKDVEKKFYMTNSSFDSGKIQFTLIDVRFLNPANADEVAYHLYVPVFVKKVLSYTFNIAVQGGTNYLSGNYTDRYGTGLIENTGTPVTFYFNYTYDRNKTNWETAINSGENVNRNYDKKLNLYKSGTSDKLEEWPEDTVLVLVDVNRGGKPYYATIKSALSGTVLDLQAFREILNADGTFGGDYFSPISLDTMLSVTVSADNENGTLVQCAEGDATMIDRTGQGYRPWEEEDGAVQKYIATVSNAAFTERYYLSVFTESNPVNDLLFHYYLVTAPTSFGDPDYPSKISDTNAHTMVHLVMGKIFYHSVLSVSSNTNLETNVMTNDNNQLIVDMSVQLGLSDDLDEDIKSEVQSLIAASEVYQSFLVYLNKREGAYSSKVIIGNPSVAASYTVDTILNGEADVPTVSRDPSDDDEVRITQNYVEVITDNLNNRFSSGKFEVNASVTLTYDNTGILAQFPGHNDLYPDNGVTVSAASNVAFSKQGTTYSKNNLSENETPAQSYYSEAEPIFAVLDLNPIVDRTGDFTQLGINASNNDNMNWATFDLLGAINIAAVEEQVTGYETAKITVKLSQKNADGVYGNPLSVATYFNLSFDGNPEVTTANEGKEYTTITSSLTVDGADIVLPVMHFSVKTGGLFEAAGLTYGNFRVDVEVVLRKGNGSEIAASKASNYVIYTNARINPNYLG